MDQDCPTVEATDRDAPASPLPPSQIELQEAVADGPLSPQVAHAILDLARASEFIKLYDVAHPLRRRLIDAALLIDDQARALREAARYEPEFWFCNGMLVTYEGPSDFETDWRPLYRRVAEAGEG